jgi:DNA-binding transcriptional LysR family regulator
MDTKQLDLNLLLALDALLAERNVTKAAARLHISQPALSAQLARLRDVFSDPLLTPIQRGMAPTARALELQEPLREVLDNVRAVVDRGAALNPAKAKLTLSLAASDYEQYAVLMPFISRLREVAPQIKVALMRLNGTLLEKQMEAGEIDLAIMNPLTAPPNLRSRHLHDDRYVCIVRKDHPRVKRKMTIELMATLEHIVVSPRGGSFRGATDDAMAAHGKKRKVTISASSFLWVPEMVQRSDMMALVPERLVRERSDQLTILESPIPVPGFSVSMLWNERTHTHKAYQWIREQLLLQFSKDL